MASFNSLLSQSIVQLAIVMFVVVAVTGLAAGIGLIVSSQRTVRLFNSMNRWVSTRHALRALEVPRDTERMSHLHQRWLAGAFVIGGLISTVGLALGYDSSAISAAVAESRYAPVVAIAMESVKWFLIVGSVFGVVVGAMLLFYPDAERTLERFANQWVSSRKIARTGDDMHMPLDRLVEAHPKIAGWIIACTSVAAVIFGIVMLVRYY
ncbi:MAG: hypothetical protein WBO23_09235 [Burkholderiales bacterium]